MKTNSSLDLSRLENVRERVGKVIARCPACSEMDRDKTGEHLAVFPDGKFGCVAYPKDRGHRSRIYALAGDLSRKRIRKTCSVRPWTIPSAHTSVSIKRQLETWTSEVQNLSTHSISIDDRPSPTVIDVGTVGTPNPNSIAAGNSASAAHGTVGTGNSYSGAACLNVKTESGTVGTNSKTLCVFKSGGNVHNKVYVKTVPMVPTVPRLDCGEESGNPECPSADWQCSDGHVKPHERSGQIDPAVECDLQLDHRYVLRPRDCIPNDLLDVVATWPAFINHRAWKDHPDIRSYDELNSAT